MPAETGESAARPQSRSPWRRLWIFPRSWTPLPSVLTSFAVESASLGTLRHVGFRRSLLGQPRRLAADRQREAKDRPAPFARTGGDSAAVHLHDALADHWPQA